MNPRVTDEAGGYEPPAAATNPRRRRRQRGLHTQPTDNQQALLREPACEVARVQRTSGRVQLRDREVQPCELLRARSDRRRERV